METNGNTALVYRNLADDPEFIKACEQALQDPALREQIICILQRAESVRSSDRQLA